MRNYADCELDVQYLYRLHAVLSFRLCSNAFSRRQCERLAAHGIAHGDGDDTAGFHHLRSAGTADRGKAFLGKLHGHDCPDGLGVPDCCGAQHFRASGGCDGQLLAAVGRAV